VVAQIFLTCGMDWCIRIWAEGVSVPLVTLQSGMLAVEDALWSPLHSTIILSLTGKQIEIWDIRRSTSKPKSSLTTPSASFNTKLHFTPDG
jgi:WD40 repeat protein